MVSQVFKLTLIISFILFSTAANSASIVDQKISPEIILDGMTHFEADQGLKEYSVNILQTDKVIDSYGTSQVEKTKYFMAPDVSLTLVGEVPINFSNDRTFSIFLDKMNLERLKDESVKGELCFKVLATPLDPVFAEFTKTYYVSKKDYRKVRIVSIRSEMDRDYIKYVMDFYYETYRLGRDNYKLLNRSEVTAYDHKNKSVMERTNEFRNYEIDLGLTEKWFEDILKDYNPFFSEGT